LAYQFGPEWFLKVCKQKTPGQRLKRLVKNRTTQNINRLGETMPPPFVLKEIPLKNSRFFFGANVKIKEKFWNNQKSWTGGLNT
jgi:hypothetical protein